MRHPLPESVITLLERLFQIATTPETMESPVPGAPFPELTAEEYAGFLSLLSRGLVDVMRFHPGNPIRFRITEEGTWLLDFGSAIRKNPETFSTKGA